MDLRNTLFKLGTPTLLLDTALQYIWYLPETIDPDTQGPIVIIRALQTGLRRLGYTNVRVTGVFDGTTVYALDQVSLPPGSWRTKTWAQLLDDVTSAMRMPFRRMVEKGAYEAQSGIFDTLFGRKPPAPVHVIVPSPPIRPPTVTIYPPVTATPVCAPCPPCAGGTPYTTAPVTVFPSKSKGTLIPMSPPGLSGFLDDLIGAVAGQNPSAAPVVLKWKTSGTNSIPADSVTKDVFKALQRQINRLLPSVGVTALIAEDGAIGLGTVGALQKLSSIVPAPTSSDGVAQNAVAIGGRLALAAAARGITPDANKPKVPAPFIPPPPATVPVTVGTETVTPQAAAAMGVTGWGQFKMDAAKYWPYAAVTVGVAGALIYWKRHRRKAASV